MTARRAVSAALMALALLGCRADQAGSGAQSAQADIAESGLPVIPLQIRTAAGIHKFSVELASTPDEQARGLMFRESLADDRGMLFPFSPPRPAGFWMKNTLIPLDMLFVRKDGSIARIAANTVPHSLETVGVGEPVLAVLELRGGRSAELGIKEGDRVSWPGGPR